MATYTQSIEVADLAKVDLLYYSHALKRRGLFEIVENEMSNKAKLRVNDLVRVVQSDGTPGPTVYLLEWIGERGYCVIREAGKPLAGGREFDLSLLVKEARDRKAA